MTETNIVGKLVGVIEGTKDGATVGISYGIKDGKTVGKFEGD